MNATSSTAAKHKSTIPTITPLSLKKVSIVVPQPFLNASFMLQLLFDAQQEFGILLTQSEGPKLPQHCA